MRTGCPPDGADFGIGQHSIARRVGALDHRQSCERIDHEPAPLHRPAIAGAAVGQRPTSDRRLAVTGQLVENRRHRGMGQCRCRPRQMRSERHPQRAFGLGGISQPLAGKVQFRPLGYQRVQCEAGFLPRRRSHRALPLILSLRFRPLGCWIDALRHAAQPRTGGGTGLRQRDSAPRPQRLTLLPARRGIGPLADEHSASARRGADPKPAAFGIEDQSILRARRGAKCSQECIGQLWHRPLQILRTPCGPGSEVRSGSAWRLMATTLLCGPREKQGKWRVLSSYGWVVAAGYRLLLISGP